MENRTYIAIDLKSFYASVECVERGRDPLTTNLVVADANRTEKTICLAVSPSLKAYGIGGRPRLFEVVQQVERVNAERRRKAPGRVLKPSEDDDLKVREDPSVGLGYIVAPPRMAHYMTVSSRIYAVYLKYVAPEDIHVYSIDEVFIDATDYLRAYSCTAHDLAMRMIRDVLSATGITATAGIGPNLYLAKIAMDIEAKTRRPDADGVRVAELDEMSYRQKYWTHRPLTDFWRIGPGIAARLEANGLFTLGDVARASLGQPWQRWNPDLLYKLFGVNAELLIDHAWGRESCTMADIKAYRPSSGSISTGQVLQRPYPAAMARTVVREMADMLALELVEKRLVTDQMVLSVGYDMENLSDPERDRRYRGPVVTDRYGRRIPKSARGSANLGRQTSSARRITDAVMELYDRIVDPDLLVRRMYVVAARVKDEAEAKGEQLQLFEEPFDTEKERSRQEAILSIRRKYGKNAILKGTNFEEGATARDRNKQIGGHKA